MRNRIAEKSQSLGALRDSRSALEDTLRTKNHERMILFKKVPRHFSIPNLFDSLPADLQTSLVLTLTSKQAKQLPLAKDVQTDAPSVNTEQTEEWSGHRFYEELQRKSQGFLKRVLSSDKPTYPELLKQVAKKAGCSDSQLDTWQLEKELVLKIFGQFHTQVSPEGISASSSRSASIALTGSGVALTAATLSGFGVYTAASTLVGGLTSLVGVTLPFAFYTTMSSVIAFATGPVGWIALCAATAGFFLGPDKEAIRKTVVLLASSRVMISEKMEIELSRLDSEIESLQKEIGDLERQIQEQERAISAHRYRLRAVVISITALAAVAVSLALSWWFTSDVL